MPAQLLPNGTAGESAKQTARQLRRDWSRRLAWRTLWFVGVPTALAIVYYGFWASDQFDSTAVLALEGAEPVNLPKSDALLSAQSNSSTSNRELLAMREFILSRAMFEAIDQRLGLVRHFQSKRWDVFARLSSRALREQAFRYYVAKITADVDSASGTLVLRARAFQPRTAADIAESIVAVSGAKLEATSEQTRIELLRNANKQVSESKERLVAARQQHAPDTANPDVLERARLDLSFAERAYESSISMLSDLQLYELRHRRRLVAIAKPSLPDESAYPRRIASVVAVSIFGFLIMGIGTLTVTAVREHVRV
jgi:capsule polysaccharide export protein KpsE/RkpR